MFFGEVDAFEPGARFRVFGEVRNGAQGLEIVHPEYKRLMFDAPLDAALTPVYPATEGLGQKTLLRLVRDALLADASTSRDHILGRSAAIRPGGVTNYRG